MCKIFGPKIWSCKIFDKFQVCVKDLHSYIQLHANSESDMLNEEAKELPLVLGGDAGGGRFVAEFSFLSRKDKSLKLHPICLYEGTDCRENL